MRSLWLYGITVLGLVVVNEAALSQRGGAVRSGMRGAVVGDIVGGSQGAGDGCQDRCGHGRDPLRD